jgi:hypothetical protein
MWIASGAAIAHVPNLTEPREPDTGGANIRFDSHRHSRREAGLVELQRRHTERRTLLGPTESLSPKKQPLDLVQHAVADTGTPAKETWTKATLHGFAAF